MAFLLQFFQRPLPISSEAGGQLPVSGTERKVMSQRPTAWFGPKDCYGCYACWRVLPNMFPLHTSSAYDFTVAWTAMNNILLMPRPRYISPWHWMGARKLIKWSVSMNIFPCLWKAYSRKRGVTADQMVRQLFIIYSSLFGVILEGVLVQEISTAMLCVVSRSWLIQIPYMLLFEANSDKCKFNL